MFVIADSVVNLIDISEELYDRLQLLHSERGGRCVVECEEVIDEDIQLEVVCDCAVIEDID